MKNIWTVMKKELARVFKDKKLIVTIFILPGLIIFTIYTLMGAAMGKMIELDGSYEISVINLPEELKTQIRTSFNADNKTVTFIDEDIDDLEFLTNEIKENNMLILIQLNEDDQQLIYYFNTNSIKSMSLYGFIAATLAPEAPKLNVGGIDYEIVDMVISDETSSNELAMMLPMLIIVFLFQGALAVGPESIAGDKERGTIATLLATPTKRSEIAMGKILSLSVLAVLASLSSFIGIMASFPKLASIDEFHINYHASTYFYILIVLITSVILITSLISVISAYAKTVKEAAALSAPIMIISMVIGLTMMFDTSTNKSIYLYLIPIYNTAILLKNAFMGNNNIIQLLIGSAANIGFSAILVFLLTKMFNSEKIMFTRR